ncbi:DUF3570 domain-containing protein [Flavobacteriaceae bacterium 3-367]
MNRKWMLAGSLAFTLLLSKAQQKKSDAFEVNETEVEMLYNQYLQTGDNSAVTGGTGTERLTVYGPSFSLKKTFGKNTLDFQLGADIISSASTDNIDQILSSASRLDARSYTNLHYSRFFEKSKVSISIGLSGSIESDYFSIGKFLSVSKTTKDDMETFSAQFQLFNDDLRWGRLQDGFLSSPKELIYPSELRFREWHDIYHRDSYNLNLGYTRIVNRRNTFGLFTALSLQEGLLATPFHRVFFTDGTAAVENFPRKRYKGALALKWNSFVGGNVVVKNTVNGYTDSFRVSGFSVDHETSLKLGPQWSLLPSFRFYVQKGAKYFARFAQHSPDALYHTSDFDLSPFRSYKFGLGWRHWPAVRKNKGLNAFSLRYFYYSRSDGLRAHTLSTAFNFKSRKAGRKNPGKKDNAR